MFRLMTWACPRCGNTFHVEVEAADPPAAGYQCKCPRCYGAVPVPGGDAGVPHEQSTPWAVRAAPAG